MIRVPTGLQDYRPALYGGIAALELARGRRPRVALTVSADGPRRAPGRLPTPARRAIRASTTGRSPSAASTATRTSSPASTPSSAPPRGMRAALERDDWPAAGAALAEEWRARTQLAPAVTTPPSTRCSPRPATPAPGPARSAAPAAAAACSAWRRPNAPRPSASRWRPPARPCSRRRSSSTACASRARDRRPAA